MSREWSSPYNFSPDDAFRFASEQRIQTKIKGQELIFHHCPYCQGGKSNDKYTFAINLSNGAHNCKRAGCGVHGNMVTLHRDFAFSLGKGVDAYFDGNHGGYKPLTRGQKPLEVRPKALEYLAKRGISAEIAKRYEITTLKNNPDTLVFPFYDTNGVLWSVKYRNTAYVKGETKGSKEWCEKERKPILFGMNHCDFTKDKDKPLTLVMTEGQIDSLTLAECGIKNAVSVPMGKSGFTWIPYCWNFLGRFDELIVFGDCENGKITLLKEMESRFHGRVKFVRPENYKGCKDANEIYQKYGKQAVVDAVTNAKAVPIRQVKPMQEVQRVDLSQLENISTGIGRLDGVISGFFAGSLILVTGKRGEGKSTLVSQMAVKAIDEDFPVFIYSGELMDWSVKDSIELQIAGKKYTTPKENGNRVKIYVIKDAVADKIEKWYTDKLYIYDNVPSLDPEIKPMSVVDAAEESIKQYGVRFVVLDNLMTAIDLTTDTDIYQKQAAFVKRLAGMAKRYAAIIILVAHPRKESSNRSGVFSADDVSGSGHITDLVDVIINYARPSAKKTKKGQEEEDYDPDTPDRIISVHKNRYGGQILSKGFTAYYEPESKRISDSPINFDLKLHWETDDDGFIPISDEDLNDLPFE